MIQYKFGEQMQIVTVKFKDRSIRMDGFGRVVFDECPSDEEHLRSSKTDPSTNRPQCRHLAEEAFREIAGKRGSLEMTVIFREPGEMEDTGCGDDLDQPLDPAVTENFEKYWKHLVTDSKGNLKPGAVARELFDFSFLMDQASKVYMDVTGGRMSKTNYFANAVIGEATDYQNTLWDDVLKDEKSNLIEQVLAEVDTHTGEDLGDLKKNIKKLLEAR